MEGKFIEKFTLRKIRSTYYDLVVLPVLIISFIFGLVNPGQFGYLSWSIFIIALFLLIFSFLNTRINITATEAGLQYKYRGVEFSSTWQDITSIDIHHHTAIISNSNQANSFKITTKNGNTEWMTPSRGDNFTYLFKIIKERSGITPGLSSTSNK